MPLAQPTDIDDLQSISALPTAASLDTSLNETLETHPVDDVDPLIATLEAVLAAKDAAAQEVYNADHTVPKKVAASAKVRSYLKLQAVITKFAAVSMEEQFPGLEPFKESYADR